jgi:Leucine-rich repeat (LRR) protein
VIQLVHLNISYNNLLELPALDKLWSLQVLDASHNSIDQIPEKMFKAQNNIRIINLSDNHITKLPDSLFLSCKSLEILDLSNNFIRFFHPSLFFGLNLQTLLLQRNRLQDVGTMFYNLKQLQELNLSSNEITDTIQRSTFPENLVMLDLSYNRIENIRPYSFVGLNNIRMIDLRYNHISTLSKESLKVSTGPYAQTGFRINENPLICDCNLVWLKQWNQATSGPIIVNLNSTRCSGAYDFPKSPVKSVPEDRFLCKYKSVCTSACKCCDFTACDCKYRCPDNCECYKSADFLSTHYIKCSNKNITTIDKFIPKIANKLDYSGSDLVHLESHSFIGMSNLKSLFLNNSNIKLISNGTFIGLTQLKTLYLSNNYIKTLWKDMFVGLDNLEKIYLDNNYISVIQDGVFNHISTLTKLSLHDNFLQYMTDYVSSLVFSVEDIELYSNPWICNCILFFSAREQPRAFISTTAWINSDFSKIKCSQHSLNGLNQNTDLQDYRGNCELQTTTVKMTVASANDLESPDISFVKPSSDTTRDKMSENSKENGVVLENINGKIWKDTMKIFIPAIIGATLLFIAVLIVLCRREFLKCWLITKFKYKAGDIELLYDKMRFYDAFIAYHPRDELYVIRDLALRLERGQPKYLLQLQHRDCPSGTSVPNYIDSSVKSSHRTVIVLSKEFMADSMSLKCVLESVKLDSVKRLVVVVLDKIDKTKLDPVVQTIIKKGKSIHFGERFFWQKLKFCLPEPGKVERDNARAEVHPYACTDISRLSSTVRDNQAYEEPFSGSTLANRPLPTVGEYSSTSQTYHYAADSQQSNIYEEIKDHENTSLKYAEPWSDSQLQTNVETLSRASKV